MYIYCPLRKYKVIYSSSLFHKLVFVAFRLYIFPREIRLKIKEDSRGIF